MYAIKFESIAPGIVSPSKNHWYIAVVLRVIISNSVLSPAQNSVFPFIFIVIDKLQFIKVFSCHEILLSFSEAVKISISPSLSTSAGTAEKEYITLLLT